MDTKSFLASVLPCEGNYALAVPLPQGGLRHIWFDNIDKMQAAAERLDAAEKTVFFACASFVTRDNRKQNNVARVRSAWLDIDCGPGKPYPTQADGARAIIEFRTQLQLPAPLIVSSGNGLHVYWRFTEDLDLDTWRRLATALKSACRKSGLQADPSRTADASSILRPPGTHHRKGAPKLVRVVSQGKPDNDHVEFLTRLVAYTGDDLDALAPRASALPKSNINSDLTGGIEYAPSSAHEVADHCGVIGLMRETRGNVDQPTWFHALQVLRHTIEGDEICHEWSNGHPKYTAAETDQKLAQVSEFGPTTCAKFRDLQPDICAKCVFKVTSPIQLGAQVQETVELPKEFSEAKITTSTFGGDEETEIRLPHGYHYGHWAGLGNALFVTIPAKDDDDEDKVLPFCRTLFYPVHRMRVAAEDATEADDGGVDETNAEYCLEIEQVDRKNVKRRFTLPSSLIGEGGKSLFGALAKHEIVAMPGMKPQVEAYLAKFLSDLQARQDAIASRIHFGWHGRDFLVGNTMYTADGEHRAVLAGNAVDKLTALTPQGSLDTWRTLVDLAYNKPGQETFQFMVMTSFASVLLPLLGTATSGIMVYAHTEKSGKGKTTAADVALSAWGNYKDLQMSHEKVTLNSLWALMGTYHNLPVVYDELTHIPAEEASSLIYNISNGKAKQRLAQNGRLRSNNSGWATIVLGTGNNLISEKLSHARADSSPELARLFEFTVRVQPHLTVAQAKTLFPKFERHYGHAGRMYAQYLVQHYDEVLDLLHKVQRACDIEAGINQLERYWSTLIACVLTACILCRRLDLVRFDVRALRQWIVDQVKDNREMAVQSVQDPREQFGTMLAELYVGIIVTEGVGDLRTGHPCIVVTHPRGPLVGRVVRPSPKGNERLRLYLNMSVVKDWCIKHGVSAREMFEACKQSGWVEPQVERFSLGKGTLEYANSSSGVRCWVVDPYKIDLSLDNTSTRIIQTVINGAERGNRKRHTETTQVALPMEDASE